MTRLSATEVSRSFSRVLNRVGAGEEVEVVRNGVPIVQMRPASSETLVSAQRWRELMASAPPVDEAFERDIEQARDSVPPPSGEWPS